MRNLQHSIMFCQISADGRWLSTPECVFTSSANQVHGFSIIQNACTTHGRPTLKVPEMTQKTLKRANHVVPNSRSQESRLVLIINEDVSILVLRQSDREPAPFRDLVTLLAPRLLTWHPAFSLAPKNCTKYSLSVRYHYTAYFTRRLPAPPLVRCTACAKVHACKGVSI
jgi:hypothetical protein